MKSHECNTNALKLLWRTCSSSVFMSLSGSSTLCVILTRDRDDALEVQSIRNIQLNVSQIFLHIYLFFFQVYLTHLPLRFCITNGSSIES